MAEIKKQKSVKKNIDSDIKLDTIESNDRKKKNKKSEILISTGISSETIDNILGNEKSVDKDITLIDVSKNEILNDDKGNEEINGKMNEEIVLPRHANSEMESLGETYDEINEMEYIETPDNVIENKKNKIGDLNINLFNRLILNYKKREYNDKKAPNIHNAHGALYFMNIALYEEIIKNAIINTTKDVVGIVMLDYTILYNSLGNNDDLRSVYIYYRSLYDDIFSYNAEYTVTYTNMMNKISKIDERIKLTNDNAYNFLIFLLLKTTKEIIRIADIIRISGKMGTINENHIINAIKIMFGNRHLAKILINKILDGVKTMSQNKSKQRKSKQEINEQSEVINEQSDIINISENNLELNKLDDTDDENILSEDEI